MLTNFPVLQDLPAEVRAEIARISKIPVGQRSAGEAAYLAARVEYISFDVSGNISKVSDTAIPAPRTPGYAPGCVFIKVDFFGNVEAVYENTGDETRCNFAQSGREAGAEIIVSSNGTGDFNVPSGILDSDVQINRAMLLSNAVGGGIVKVQAGTFTISDVLQHPSNVKLRGSGIDITIIKSRNTYTPTASVYGSASGVRRVQLMSYNSAAISNSGVEDITWDANVQNNAGLTNASTHRNIWIRYATNYSIRRCKGINAIHYTFTIGDSDKVWVEDNIVLGGYSSTYTTNDGIHFRNTKNFFCRNNYIDTAIGGGTSGDDCIAVIVDSNATEDVVNGVIEGNIINGSGSRGIAMDIDSSFNIKNITMSRNVISNTQNAGIKLYFANGKTGIYQGVSLDGNILDNIGIKESGSDGGDGIRIDKDYGGARLCYQNLSICGNIIKSMVYSAGYGIQILGGTKGLVLNNNSVDGMEGLAAIKIGSSSNVVSDYVASGNKCDVTAGVSSVKGMYIRNADRGIINANQIYGHVTGTTHGIYLDAESGKTTSKNIVSSNNVYTFDNGITEASAGANPDYNYFTGNNTVDCTNEITLVGVNSVKAVGGDELNFSS